MEMQNNFKQKYYKIVKWVVDHKITLKFLEFLEFKKLLFNLKRFKDTKNYLKSFKNQQWKLMIIIKKKKIISFIKISLFLM